MAVKIKSSWWLIAVVIAVPVVLVLGWMLWPDQCMSLAKQDIVRIEAFRAGHGRLPDSFAEIGVQEDESGPVYYKKQNETSYIVWYGMRLGESEIYDSQTREWGHR